MSTQSTNVETYMVALGQPVRHQPITSIRAHEAVSTLERLLHHIDGLAIELGVTLNIPTSLRYTDIDPTLRPDVVLLRLANLQYALLQATHTLGHGDLLDPAVTELHASNMSRVHDDGTIHRDAMGIIVNPPFFFPPSMSSVITAHGTQPTLFSDPVPTTVLDDTTE